MSREGTWGLRVPGRFAVGFPETHILLKGEVGVSAAATCIGTSMEIREMDRGWQEWALRTAQGLAFLACGEGWRSFRAAGLGLTWW